MDCLFDFKNGKGNRLKGETTFPYSKVKTYICTLNKRPFFNELIYRRTQMERNVARHDS